MWVKINIRGLQVMLFSIYDFRENRVRGLHIVLFIICDFRENRHKRSAYNAVRICFFSWKSA